MKKVSHKTPKVKTIRPGQIQCLRHAEKKNLSARDTRIALIQALIPLGLDAVAEEFAE